MIIIYPEYFEIPVTKSGKCSIFSGDSFMRNADFRGEDEDIITKKGCCDEFAYADEEYIENELGYMDKKE